MTNAADFEAILDRAERILAKNQWTAEALWAADLASELHGALSEILAERDALRAQLDKATAVMRQYENWFDGAPEDSWRLQRDMMAALDMVEVTD